MRPRRALLRDCDQCASVALGGAVEVVRQVACREGFGAAREQRDVGTDEHEVCARVEVGLALRGVERVDLEPTICRCPRSNFFRKSCQDSRRGHVG